MARSMGIVGVGRSSYVGESDGGVKRWMAMEARNLSDVAGERKYRRRMDGEIPR